MLEPQDRRAASGLGLHRSPERREIAHGVKCGDRLALPAMQEAKMVVQTGPRLKRGFEGRIERGKFCCAAAASSLGLRRAARRGIRRRRGFVGRGLTMSVSGLKCGLPAAHRKTVRHALTT